MNQKKNNYLEAYSIHIFAYPIKISYLDKKMKKSIDESLEKCGWTNRGDKQAKEWETAKTAYASKQYRTKNAKRIFDGTEPLCKTYVSDKVSTGEYTFNISCGISNYILDIDEMELHKYSDEFAIIFIKALNMSYSDIDIIKSINDLGRCMGLPFIPEQEDGFISCPDKIEICDKDKNSCAVIEYRKIASEMCVNKDATDRDFKASYISNLFNNFISDKNENKNENKNEKEIIKGVEIETINDYRCFLISLIRDKELSYNLTLKKMQESPDFDKKWYAILHIDSGEASCANREMLRRLLDEKSYCRWIENGTIYGVTEYSFVALTTSAAKVNTYVVGSFYTSYMDMISLVLAQKIGLMNLMHEVEDTAKNFKKRLIETGELIKLQKKYAIWKNEILISEYSDQEQGIELYKLMQEQMLVFKEKADLDEKIQALYEISVVNNEKNLNLIGLFIAVASFIISIIALVIG